VKASERDSRSIGEQQQRHQRDEFRTAVRALLMTPLMTPAPEDFAAVRRQADALRDWFSRETGWVLHIEREGARLYKRPANLADATRGLPGYERRRYVLLCLACAVLERAEPQITLRVLGERLLLLASEPALDAHDFSFTLAAQHERRELVAVCRTLLDAGVLLRVAGDEDAFVQTGSNHSVQGDALYDVQRRTLAGMLAAARGPSTWTAEEAPVSFDARLMSLVDEHVADSDEGRRTALRHQLARRLLDDPVVYTADLDTDARAYFINQRGTLATRLCEATGLTTEQRAEGLALIDEGGTLTDIAMPAEGTEAHVTLLVAEYLASGLRQLATARARPEQDIAEFLRRSSEHYGRYWRKSAREPGAEKELAAIALDRLEKLQLITRHTGTVQALPALARFALGDSVVRTPAHSAPTRHTATASLFDPT
jgi:uncharacterized protein (TIGR02678 family)